MISAETKNRLSIIFGDDLEAVGNVIVVRTEGGEIHVVNTDGEFLVPNAVHGIGMFLGPGGFNYVVLTKKKEKSQTIGRGFSSYTITNNRYTFNVYDSKFNWVSVSETTATVSPFGEKMDISLRGKLMTIYLKNGILMERESALSYF